MSARADKDESRSLAKEKHIESAHDSSNQKKKKRKTLVVVPCGKSKVARATLGSTAYAEKVKGAFQGTGMEILTHTAGLNVIRAVEKVKDAVRRGQPFARSVPNEYSARGEWTSSLYIAYDAISEDPYSWIDMQPVQPPSYSQPSQLND